MNNSESFILQRLSLINLTSKGFIPRDEYKKLQRKNEEINKDIKNLEYIRENIIIYHKVYYQDTIKKIIDIIHDNKNKEISQYKTEGKIKEIIKESDNLKVLAEKVEKVKNFLLFNVLYELNIAEDEDKTFNKAYKELDNIRDLLHNNIGVDELYKKYKVVFDKIRDKLSNNEETAKEFIKYLTDYYNINNENLIDDLKILFKSKKYELDINSIIFFFDNFKKEYSEDKEWDNKLSNKYKDLSQKSFEEIKLELKELQKNEIYNYNDVQDYILFYTCLYDKKEAIDFLLTKIDKNLDDLKDRIQPTDKKLTYKDILDTEDCISHFKKMNGMEFKNKIFNYIKTSIGENKNVISQFENYSKIYNSIIELDRYYDSSDNFYEQINNIIKDELSLPITKDLSSNFEKIYDLIISNEEIKKDEQFYNELRYILFKEINKISDNNYQSDILDKLLEKKEMIKKSNDIFQILLKNNLKKDKYKDSANSILTGDNIILKIIEKGLNKKNFILSETLFYLFEKNTLNYLKSVLKNKSVDLDNEPLEILKECIKILELYINKPEKFEGKIKELCKLFCLSYIKTYCYIFIKSFESANPKVKNPKDIIDSINNNNNLCKMIRLYIYKILYNNYTIEFFDNKENIIKYNLNNYSDFNKIMKIQDSINIYQIDYKIKTLNEGYYDKAYEVIKQYKSEDFKTKISGIFISDYKLYEYGIDNFYVVTYNSTLSNLLKRKYKFNNNFYTNICQPLFEKEKLLLKGIQLFYEEDKYKRIARLYKIEFNNIRPLLFGYRYCLNELFLKNTLGIYYPLYQGKVNYLKEKFYPGNDTKFNKVYSYIKNHFKIKPEEGCYVCLCKEWFYHSIPSGFPGKSFLNKSCPKCHKSVGATKKGNKIEIIKRDGYFRIFKDKKEIELINNDKSKKEKLKEINYMTLEQFEEQYIIKQNKEEKGIFITDKNGFKNDKKIIRYLSQISYRLLNYILYVHLFFARAVSDKNNFDKYIPKNMGEFVDTINECWKILKNELLKLNIDSIEEFMHYVFIYLFPILNKEKAIDTYEQLISFENILEKKIQELIIRFKDGSNKLEPMKETDINEDVATINLLKEKYASSYYNESEYPFYDYFYYTDYLNENYIYEKLNQNDPNTYPILKLYLDSILLKDEKKKYSLNKLNLFNSTLNLINEKYTNKISREIAKKRLKDDEVYINNKELFDNFIKFYNKLEFKIQLTTENKLCDFFIDEDNEYGKTYLNIYKEFIKKQNEEIFGLKLESGIFDETCKNKINIQQINEEEIFNLELPEDI